VYFSPHNSGGKSRSLSGAERRGLARTWPKTRTATPTPATFCICKIMRRVWVFLFAPSWAPPRSLAPSLLFVRCCRGQPTGNRD